MLLFTWCVTAATTYIFIISTMLSFFIGIFLYLRAFYKHFTVLVKEINDSPIKNKDLIDSPDVIRLGKDIYEKQMLRKLIQLHIMAKGYVISQKKKLLYSVNY